MGRNSAGVISNGRNGSKGTGTPASVLAAEHGIRGNNYETAYIFDGKGKQLKKIKGDAKSVDIGIPPKDSIITHNHPSNRAFSAADILTAVTHDVKEIRAVGATYTYSLKRPKGGWEVNHSKGVVKLAIAEARRMAKEQTDRYYANGNGSSRANGANMLLPHLTMKLLAQEMGWEYTKKRIK